MLDWFDLDLFSFPCRLSIWTIEPFGFAIAVVAVIECCPFEAKKKCANILFEYSIYVLETLAKLILSLLAGWLYLFFVSFHSPDSCSFLEQSIRVMSSKMWLWREYVCVGAPQIYLTADLFVFSLALFQILNESKRFFFLLK